MKSSTRALVVSGVFGGALVACLFVLWVRSQKMGEPAVSEDIVALQTERDRLQKLLELEPCALAATLGLTPDNPAISTKPETTSSPVAPAGTLPTQTGTPEKATSEHSTVAKSGRTNIAHQVEAATVLVLNLKQNGDLGIGSGFFVAPGVIVTNRHVAEGVDSTLLVANKSMNRLLPARLIAQSSRSGQDYAVIRIAVPAGTQSPILPLRSGAERTEKISAWGYPTAVTRNDPAYQALLRGDVKAIPEVVYSEGVISVVLERKPPLIAHTAALSPGNSGGPLVDEDGNCVGVNTMITLDEESYRQTSLSLAAADLIAFLRSVGVTDFVASSQPAVNASPRP